MLYTIIDPETIWQYCEEEKQPKQSVIDYNGIKLEVALLNHNTYIVNKIISTCPKDYLRPELQPGSKIQLILKAQD